MCKRLIQHSVLIYKKNPKGNLENYVKNTNATLSRLNNRNPGDT